MLAPELVNVMSGTGPGPVAPVIHYPTYLEQLSTPVQHLTRLIFILGLLRTWKLLS